MGVDWPQKVLGHTAHRPWPMPQSPWLMTMSWVDLLAAHWPVDPEVIDARLPDGLTVDTWQGDAWLSIIPFVMDNTLARGLTWWPRPFRFLELNLRTYVTVEGQKPGVWFFSLDASSRLAVTGARKTFYLPYFRAAISRERDGDRTLYSSRRTHPDAAPGRFVARYGPDGPVSPAEENTLDHWLMERYCLYAQRNGQLYRGDIHHPRWPLQPAVADIETNTLFESFDLPVSGRPARLHYADQIDVLGWWKTTVDGDEHRG